MEGRVWAVLYFFFSRVSEQWTQHKVLCCFMVPTDGVFQSESDGWPESSFPHHHLWHSPPHPLWTGDAWDPGEVLNIQENVPKPQETWRYDSSAACLRKWVLWEWAHGSPAVPSPPFCLPRSSSLSELYHTCHFWLHPLSPGCPVAGSFHVY